MIDITNGTYGAIYGGNNTSGKIYGSITINVHEEGCKPIVIDKLYGGGFNADYSIYGFNDDGTARTRAQYEALEDKTGITVQRDPQINIISATKIGKIYGGGFNAKLIGSPSINVNMEKGFVAARYVKEDTDAGTGKFTPGDHSVTEHGMDCSYTVENKDADGKAILAIGSVGSIYGGGFKGDVQGNTSVAIGTGEWLSFTGQRETSDADGKVYTYNTTTQKWDWTQTVDETTTSGTADEKPVPARNAATITGNVFGGGEGEALESGTDAFYCKAAMVGIDGEGLTDPAGGTSVVIANGTVGTLDNNDKLVAGTGNVYGGGEIGRVEKNTVVTIGEAPVDGVTGYNAKFTPVVRGSVFGAGKGVPTHGYSALVRGNSTVTIQGLAKVGESVYGGGEIASVGRYIVKKAQGDPTDAPDDLPIGQPYSLKDENSGNCIVKVLDNAEIGPNDMTMTKSGGPDNSGHVFGAGKGAMPYIDKDGKSWSAPWSININNEKVNYSGATEESEATYLKFIETLGLATQTDVTIGGNAFVKGCVFGGAEQGFVQHDTHVTIEGDCQIGNGYAQMADDGTYLNKLTSPVNHIAINRRYSAAEWEAGHLITVDSDPDALKTLAANHYKSSLPECASWLYGQATGTAKYAAHDIYDGTTGYDSKGGSKIADNGSTFYGNVFGGGSGYFPYAPGKWHWKAGDVGGNTLVEIKGGHILTNVYGGNELTNVTGKCTVEMSGGTIGVPRTLGQIAAHPVTCYLFGAGKGDPRVLFNKQTNVNEVEVNDTGGWIYGSVFGGGEDGHVMRDVTMTISGNEIATTKTYAEAYADLYAGRATKIGTWGTSYVDGNVFGGGRGFSGDAYTAGNVAGSVTLKISGGTMLGSIYGGGRLGSVGYGLYEATETGAATGHKMYGEMQEDGYGDWYMDGTTYKHDAIANFKRGYVTMNITGGTIGNTNEFIMPDATNIAAVNTALSTSLNTDFTKWNSENWKTWKSYYNVPNTEYDTTNGRVTHTKGGNVYAGGMGRYYMLDGVTPITSIDWWKVGNVKSTNLTISGENTWIMGNVYGGGELGAVTPYTDNTNAQSPVVQGGTTTISITGGTIGTEVTGTTPSKTTVQVPENSNSNVLYTFGSVYGGGMGMEGHDAQERHGGEVGGNTTVEMSEMSGENTAVRASVFGGGEMAVVDGNTKVTISGGKIGRDEVKHGDDPDAGYVMFGGATMGNVYGGGKGHKDHTEAGLVKGNTEVTINPGSNEQLFIYHNVYGGGALGSVGTFSTSTGTGDQAYIPEGIPYGWVDGTGTATVTVKGGTIGISGRDNGMVFGSSRGDISKPDSDSGKDPYDKVAWVNNAIVTIGKEDDVTEGPQVKGSVYGGGENGHNAGDATVYVLSGTIGIVDKDDPWLVFTNPDALEKARVTRGNVYGAGCGTDTYKGDDNQEYHNPKSGMVAGNTFVNISGGTIANSVYGGGSMGMVGTLIIDPEAKDGEDKSIYKHDDIRNIDGNETIYGFGLSWPYEFKFAPETGKATVNITGGHIGAQVKVDESTQFIGDGDVYGSARGEAGDRYVTANFAYVNETEVNVEYGRTAEVEKLEDLATPCVTGSVHGSGENGYVYGDTKVTLKEGLIGHSLYGAGKGTGTYMKELNKIGGDGTYPARIYSLIAGKVFGNTYVTMNGGHVVRNVYGGGNMGSVGKGNYASGTDDYAHDCDYGAQYGYGENIESELWTPSNGFNPNAAISDSNMPTTMADYFLSSGKTTVKVLGGIVGNPDDRIKNNMPYGNVFGGSAGEAAPNIDETPRYLYSPAFFSGYVNETDVTIGKTRGDFDTDDAYNTYVTSGAPKIYASVYGGGQDGHVRRDTKVTVNNGEIGLQYNETNSGLLRTADINDPQWLLRGNVYGAGSGVSPYQYDFNYDGDTEDDKEEGYSNSAGSVTRFTQVNVLGGTIHRNVYGGGSMGSVGAPNMGQNYEPYKKGDTADGHGVGKQSLNEVVIGGAKVGDTFVEAKIGDATSFKNGYGGNVFGASRGNSTLDENSFATSIWTKVLVKDGAYILGNVFGGGDAGKVKQDTDVQIGEKAEP